MSALAGFFPGVLAGLLLAWLISPSSQPARRHTAALRREIGPDKGLLLTLRTPADCDELGEAINALLRGLRWYCDGDNHPSTRVARQAIEEFRAATARFVDGKGTR